MKKTLLTIIAALLLGGVVNAQDWGETDSHAKSSNTPIVASVKLDGNAVTPTADYRLGAFVGEELRGLAAPHTDNNFWIQVFYNQGTTETISFKLYDGNNEYTTCSVTQTTQEEGWGTPTNPVVLDFATTQTQSMALANGWTWWSTPIEITNGETALTMLENSLGHNGMTIKSKNDFTINYYGEVEEDLWYGGLEAITNEQGYMIQTRNACTVYMTGTYANPADHEITLTQNWNWIGYPVQTSQYVTTALSGLNSSDGDLLKDKNNFATYYEGFGWYPDDFVLNPGKGYMYNANASRSFYYTTGREVVNKDNTQPDLYWVSESYKYPNTISIIAVVEIDGKEINDDVEVAAFVGNECRGSVRLRYFPPTGRYYALLSVAGINNETITFKTTDKESSTVVLFKDNEIVGSLDNPMVIDFNQTLGITEFITTYPNPVKRDQEFKMLIPAEEQISEVIVENMLGMIVCREKTNKERMFANMTPGVYLLKTICKTGNVYIGKIIVE